MGMNLLGRRKVQAVSQSNTGDRNSSKIITPLSLGEGLHARHKTDATKHTTSRSKAYIVIIVSALSAFCTGYLFNIQSLAYGAIALVVFAAIFIVQTLLLKRASEIALVAVADAVGLSLFSMQNSINIAFYLVIALMILFLLAHISNRREANNIIRLKFFGVVRPGAGFLLMALSIFIGFILLLNGNVFWEKGNVTRVVNVIGRPVFGKKIADFSAEMRFDEFLRSYIRTELSGREDFKGLSEYAKEKTISDNITGLATYIEESTGYKPQLELSVAENVQGFVTAKTQAFYPENQLIRFALVALILVVVVKGLEFLIFPILALLGLILYELLLGFGFAETQFEFRSREVINLPSRRS